MVDILGTLIFATIVGIGWFDSRGSLTLFGKYTTSISTGRRPRRPSAEHGDDRGGSQPPPAPAL
jgi:hypothetical protein